MDTPPDLPPPLPPADSDSPPPRPVWPVWMAWLVILASVGVTMWKTEVEKSAPLEPDGKVNRTFDMEGRYAAGWMRPSPLLDPTGTARSEIKKQVFDPSRPEHQTPADRLRLAIMESHLDRQPISEAALAEAATHGGRLEKDVQTLRQLSESPASANQLLGTDDWRRFAERHGWFAALAASNALPQSDPRHEAPLQAAQKTAIAMFSAALVGLGACGLGFLLLVTAIVLRLSGRWPRTLRPVPSGPGALHAGVFVEAFAVYLGGWVGASHLLSALGVSEAPILRIGIMFAFVVLAFLWPLLRRTGVSAWKESLGLHCGTGFWREVGWGILGYLAGLPLLILGAIATYKLMQWGHTDATHPIVDWFDGRAIVILMLALLAVVWAPITEEIMFRGALFAGLHRRLPWWAAAVIVAVIFAAIHPQGWAGIPALTAIAITLATLRHYRGSLIAPITAHALNNAMALTAMTFMMG